MSVSAFVTGCDKEKFIGPTGENQSKPIPISEEESIPQVIFNQTNHSFIMVINEDDYHSLDWKTYYICINVKTNDPLLTKWIEIDRKGVVNRTVEIVKDTNRE